MKINLFKFLTGVLSFYFLKTDDRIKNFDGNNFFNKSITQNNKTIIFLPYRFNYSTIWLEFLTASYLKMKGYKVLVLLAGRTITLTDGVNYGTRFSWLKEKINISRAYAYSKKFDVDLIFFDDIIDNKDIKLLRKKSNSLSVEEILSYVSSDNINHGEKVFESICRYHGSSKISKINDESIIRKFFFNSLMSEKASINSIKKFKPEKLFTSHAIYSSWGIFSEVYKKQNIDFVCWGFYYMNNAIIAAHNKSIQHSIIYEKPENYSKIHFNDHIKKVVLNYVNFKIKGSNKYDKLNYYSNKSFFDKIDKTRLKKRYCMFPNLEWDAVVAYDPTIFKSMNDWIIETVKWFVDNPKYELIIRAHPAETVHYISTQITVKEMIKNYFGEHLPKNIVIIDSNSDITSYEVLFKSDVCLIYASKIGLEAAILNKPIFLCSKSHFFDKKIAIEPRNKIDYFNLLDKDGIYKEEFNKNAITFGYYYYFKRQFYLPLLDQGRFTFKSMNDLEKGKVPNFKKFIRCILENEDFINDEDIIKKYLL